MNNRLAAQWDRYRADVIAADAPQVQIIETRRAFYAGAWAFHMLVIHLLDPSSEPTEQDIQIMTELHEEMQRFGRGQG